MDVLPTVWFALIAVLWIGYLVLEGFDLGVGLLMKSLARGEQERRVLLNTIGPVWDGNEVWLLTAGGATFAAFPLWYASLFSALYIPLVVVLLGLIFRAVAIEYRGKRESIRWRNGWDWALAGGSLIAAFGVGAMLALTTTGLPINANGDREGGLFAWFTWYAVLGGLAVVGFALVHALAFVALKTDGEIRHRARTALVRLLPVGLLPITAWVLVVQLRSGSLLTWLPIVVAVAAVVIAWIQARRGREGRAFAGLVVFLLAGATAIFSAAYPVVLPSTLNPAWDLTVSSASSSDYTLGVMTVVAAFGVPLVLAYQGWTYWVFRKRVSVAHIPEAHDFDPVAAADRAAR
ncbi:cytochrome c oxidase assembly protein [Tersicoccus solisilvae]|uniref:Cytochrome c oxidase assembly protein n=1 Tax=Tersicoccus solisilvae TaxID=1882339 RepID=A0ABQ1PMQ8_9MICC|nr:cytochrome d ubiquinol oxidase subunit II [Tersicoccus solisilvae]GGC99498.1 cytochrome c oxidase assembly protein [Tersicoccus solisilvae]